MSSLQKISLAMFTPMEKDTHPIFKSTCSAAFTAATAKKRALPGQLFSAMNLNYPAQPARG
jgi:hypothetical protein